MFVIFVTLINLEAVIYDLILAAGQEARLSLASHYFSSQSRRFSIQYLKLSLKMETVAVTQPCKSINNAF